MLTPKKWTKNDAIFSSPGQKIFVLCDAYIFFTMCNDTKQRIPEVEEIIIFRGKSYLYIYDLMNTYKVHTNFIQDYIDTN